VRVDAIAFRKSCRSYRWRKELSAACETRSYGTDGGQGLHMYRRKAVAATCWMVKTASASMAWISSRDCWGGATGRMVSINLRDPDVLYGEIST
jgi:hypothetical protein